MKLIIVLICLALFTSCSGNNKKKEKFIDVKKKREYPIQYKGNYELSNSKILFDNDTFIDCIVKRNDTFYLKVPSEINISNISETGAFWLEDGEIYINLISKDVFRESSRDFKKLIIVKTLP